MSERKVLQKYYPPEFDPSLITRTKGPKPTGPKQQTVRLMAPFSMKCVTCGEFIYKGRKFNARKENSGERYYAISIFRFYIRCTRCSAEITFKTDPKNMDYTCEKGAVRNFEPWRQAGDGSGGANDKETDEERLDRLEAEENESAMEKLEVKTLDSKREMAIADALDEIRTRNARNERVDEETVAQGLFDRPDPEALRRELEEREIEEAARRAFQTDDGAFVRRVVEDDDDDNNNDGGVGSSKGPAAAMGAATVKKKNVAGVTIVGEGAAAIEIPSFKKTVKRKRDLGAALGIKKKKVTPLV